MHPKAVRERVVTTDRDEYVDPHGLDHAQDVVGDVERSVTFRRIAEERGVLTAADLCRVRAAGMQEGPAGPVDRADRRRREVDEVLGQRFRISRIGIQEPSPAATDADNFVAFVGDASDHRLDGGVESWDVSAAGEDSDAHR